MSIHRYARIVFAAAMLALCSLAKGAVAQQQNQPNNSATKGLTRGQQQEADYKYIVDQYESLASAQRKRYTRKGTRPVDFKIVAKDYRGVPLTGYILLVMIEMGNDEYFYEARYGNTGMFTFPAIPMKPSSKAMVSIIMYLATAAEIDGVANNTYDNKLIISGNEIIAIGNSGPVLLDVAQAAESGATRVSAGGKAGVEKGVEVQGGIDTGPAKAGVQAGVKPSSESSGGVENTMANPRPSQALKIKQR